LAVHSVPSDFALARSASVLVAEAYLQCPPR
jgi:hypothetical protein